MNSNHLSYQPFFVPLALLSLIMVLAAGCTTPKGFRTPDGLPEIRYWAAPTTLPGITPEMKTCGFWIGRVAHPDRLILNKEGIRALNMGIRRLNLTRSVTQIDEVLAGRNLMDDLTHWLYKFRDRGQYFLDDGRAADSIFFEKIKFNMNLEGVTETVEWGMVTANSAQRLLPTKAVLYAEPGEIDFDRLQNNALDVGTPVAVLHRSRDGNWVFVSGPASDGWMESRTIGFCTRDTLADRQSSPYVTVIRAKGSLFQNSALTGFRGFVRMGTRLPRAEDSTALPGTVAVSLPRRRPDGTLWFDTGYIRARDTVEGSLSYTPRHIIEQAFEMLNTPYGWGGSRGEQDCSQFIQEVFACVGIMLPRNSAAQAKTGQAAFHIASDMSVGERETALLTQVYPGTALLYMKGHVMLYIGEVAGHPYAIHDIWGYTAPPGQGGGVRVINRVAVTGLLLGQGTARGSLLERLKRVCIIR